MTNAVALAIKITADGKSAAAGLDVVEKKTSRLSRAGALAGRALAAGLGLAAVAGVKAAKAAAQDEQAQAKLASALRQVTGARQQDIDGVEEWIAAQGRALGVADDELRPALENLVSATKNVGEAQRLASIAMDVSARKGVSLEAVSKSLARAVATGNVSALGKYGVATKNAEGKTRSMQAVQKDLAKLYKGGAAAAADTAAGKQKRLQVAMGELQEEIGAKLLPALLKLAEYGLKVVDWIDKNQTAAAAIVGTLFGLLAVVKLVSAATAIWNAVTKAAAAAQAIFNAVMAANPVVLVVVAVVALAAALVIAYKRSETFRNIVNKAFGAIAKTVGAVVGFIKDHWKTMLAILAGPVGLAVLLIVKHRDKILAAFGAAKDWLAGKWNAVKDLVAGPVGKAKDLIVGYYTTMKDGFVAVKDKVSEVATKIKDLASAGFRAILAPVQAVIDKIQALYDKLVALKNKASGGAVKSGQGNNNASTSQSGGGGHEPSGNQRGAVVVHVHMDRGFIGSERQLAAEFKRLVGNDVRRALGAA